MSVVPLLQDGAVSTLWNPSRPFVGRAAELAELSSAALPDDNEAAVVLLGGDAGVGKTRLLTELRERAAATGARSLLGHCLDLGDGGVPYLPFAEMFARLTQESPDAVADLVAGAPMITTLLPEQVRREVMTVPADRAALFDAVHTGLARLALSGRVLVLLEDAHWADRSTREMLTVLFSREFTAPVSIVVSYRSDDLHRRHPLRPALAEWTRIPGVHRMLLDPLVAAGVRELLRSLRPGAEASADTAAIVERSGGNPFFVEELLAATDLGAGRIPDQLADLLLVRIDALSEDARAVVRSASVAGRAVDHDLLSAVIDLPADRIDAGLRALVDNNVFITTASGGYAFRHALLGEAVYDDLLPGERVRIHQRFARALDGRPGVGVSAALARHARSAGDHVLAAVASERAGDEAMAAAGPADAARYYEDALALLAEGRNAQEAPQPVALICHAAEALIAAGDADRAMDVVHAALIAHAGPLVERAMLVVALLDAELVVDVPVVPYKIGEEAIEWLADDPPGPVLARLHAALARARVIDDDFDGALLAGNEALTIARDLDLPGVVTDAMTTIARLDDFAGDSASSIAALHDVVRRAQATHDVAAELRGLHQLARVHARADDLRAAVGWHATAARRSVETGRMTEPFAVDTRLQGAIHALVIGEWAIADDLLDVSRISLPRLPVALIESVRVQLDVQRGTGDPPSTLAELRPLWPREMFLAIHAAGATIDVHGFAGDLEAMLATYDEAVATVGSVWHLRDFDARIRLSAMALGHLATAVAAGRVQAAGYADRVRALMDAVADVVGTRRSEGALGAESRAWVMRARAEERRFCSADSTSGHVDAWREAVAANDVAEMPYEAAWCRIHLAAAVVAAGGTGADGAGARRDEARDLREQARQVAERLGSRPLLDAVGGPRRTSGAAAAAAAVVLTPRERQVLALVAEGRSNGEVAKELVISTKTASVHVSNILAKLNASSRTEAVAVARRRGLLS